MFFDYSITDTQYRSKNPDNSAKPAEHPVENKEKDCKIPLRNAVTSQSRGHIHNDITIISYCNIMSRRKCRIS